MAGIVLGVAEDQLNAWLEASIALTKSKTYTIGGRSLTRADTEHVLKMIEFWDYKVKELTKKTSINVRQVIPSSTSCTTNSSIDFKFDD